MTKSTLEPVIAGAPDAGLKPQAAEPLLPYLWRHRTTIIAAFSLAAILLHVLLRFAFHAAPATSRIPLLATLLLGGSPLLFDLLRKLSKREFGSDLLGGISVVTSVALGEYLAGSIIVLMLSGGEALESYALRSASSVLAALAKRMPSVAHRKRAADVSPVHSAFLGVFRNHWLWGAVLLSLALHALVSYVPRPRAAFAAVALNAWDWAQCFAIASSALWIARGARFFTRPSTA